MAEEPGNYIQPASNTKGVQEVPGWRDPERAAQNWRDCARYLRRYFVLMLIPALALLWFAGYAQGLLTADCPPVATRNEGVEQ